MPRPSVVCLIGSPRYRYAFQCIELEYALSGHITLSPGWFTGYGHVYAPTIEDKVVLDGLMLDKIELADFVAFVKVEGRISDTTKAELEHAAAKGKQVHVHHFDRDMTKRSILQDWVSSLGLRHQGVLLTAVRGCDTGIKQDASKKLIRCLRNECLNAHCGDNRNSRVFIDSLDAHEIIARMEDFQRKYDHYPVHFVKHAMEAFKVVGYKGPSVTAKLWLQMYTALCSRMHFSPELEHEMDSRLNAREDDFWESHDVHVPNR